MKRSLRFAIILPLTLFLTPFVLLAQSSSDNPTGPTGVYNGNVTTAGSWDPFTGNRMRVVNDIVVPGSVGAYPLKWTRYYNTNVQDGQWTFSYKDYQPLKMPDGRQLNQTPVNGVPDYTATVNVNGVLYYTTHLADGGIVNFQGQQVGLYYVYRPTQLIDPYGQVTNLTYVTRGYYPDSGNTNPIYVLDRVTEPGGRYLQLTWQNAPSAANHGSSVASVISRVEAFDGPLGNSLGAVDYHWSPSDQQHYDHQDYPILDHVIYSDQTTASYTYVTMGIPDVGDVPSMNTADDVRYDGPMRQIAYGSGDVWYSSSGEYNLNTPRELLTTLGGTSSDRQVFADNSWTESWISHQELRIDNATRTFTYSYPCTYYPHERELVCDDAKVGKLISYTDFHYADSLGNTTQIGYEETGPGAGYINSVTDPNGHTTTYTRNATWNVTRVDYPDGSFIEQTYTDNANPYFLASRTAQRGPNDPPETTIYTRDTQNRITRKDYPDGGYEEFTYNGFGQVLDHHLTSGGWEHFAYDSRGLKISYTDATGGVTTYSYYTSGPWTDRLQTVTYPANASGFQATETYEYDHGFDSYGNQTTAAAAGRGLVTKVTHTDGWTVVKTYNKYGDVLASTDELGHITSSTYDEYGRVLTITTPPRFAGDTQYHTTTNSYVPTGLSSSTIHTSKLPFSITLPSGKQTTFEYDANWRKRFVHVAPNTPDAATTEYRYDEGSGNIGHLTTTLDPRINPTTYGYDVMDRQTSVTDALNHPTTTVYGQRGLIISETHANGELITFDQYDPMNRLLQKTTHRDASTIDVVHMTYDHSGNLATFQDENATARGDTTYIYSYAYDAMNRLLRMNYPNALSEVHTYDLAGNVKTYTNRAAAIQTFAYDNRNRATGFTWTNDPANTTGQTTVYDAASRKKQIVNSDATINFGYNDDNTLSSQEEWVTNAIIGDNVHRIVSYTYDPDGNRSTIQYPSGTKLDYDYTQRNQVADIKLDGQTNPIVSYGFDASGNITARTLDNGTSTSYVPDPVNRDTAVVHNLLPTGTPAKRFDYVYNSVNDILAVQRDSGGGDGYTYDLTQQITGFQREATSVDLHAGTASGGTPNTIQFDGCGNRTNLNGTPEAFNNMNQPTDVSHDNNGNVQSYNGWSYTYDAQNRLRTATNPSTGVDFHFYYDGLNRQVARSGGPTILPTSAVSRKTHGTAGTFDINLPVTGTPGIECRSSSGGAYQMVLTFARAVSFAGASVTSGTGTVSSSTSGNNGTLITISLSGVTNQQRIIVTVTGVTDGTVFNNVNVGMSVLMGDTDANGVVDGNDVSQVQNNTRHAVTTSNFRDDVDVTGVIDGNDASMVQLQTRTGVSSSSVTQPAPVIYSVWDGDWAILEEYGNSGALVQQYLQGYHGLVKTFVGTAVYYYQDEQGSTSHIANASGALIESYQYDLYGKPRVYNASGVYQPTAAPVAKDLFTGQRWVSQIGLYDDRNRFMSPDLGRFLQPDPIGFKGDTSNLYRYCGNDWANRSDLMGTQDDAGQKRQENGENPAMDSPYQDQQLQQLANARSTYNSLTGVFTIWFRGNPFQNLANQSFQMGQVAGVRQQAGSKDYPTWQSAGEAGVRSGFDATQKSHTEYSGDIGQKDGVSSGHYIFTPARPGGFGYVKDKYRQGYFNYSNIKINTVPTGYHRVGFYYVHVLHAQTVPYGDQRVFHDYHLNAVLGTPGYRGDGLQTHPHFSYYDYSNTPQ